MAEQIRSQVRAAVADGELQRGERLPPARGLAASLGINMHTVLRAYGLLRDEGLIEMRQGRGAWVSSEANPAIARVAELAGVLVAEAQKLGISRLEICSLIEEK
ncbi:MAG: GntR family transcriptional regulator [Rhodoglobus sp.]